MLALPFYRQRLLANAKRLGVWGERRCEKFLKSKGLKIITRNYRCALGEIDLIVSDRQGRIVFVEVKTRRNEDFAPAQLAVNKHKRKRMIRTANYFLKKYRIKDKPLRFDVVAVVLGQKGAPEIRHYENAFVP